MRALFLVTLFLLTGCAAEPVFVQKDIIPDNARSCVANAKALRISCKEEKIPLYEQCQTKQKMLHQQELSTHAANLKSLQAQLQSCMSRCIENENPHEEGKKNTPKECAEGYSKYFGLSKEQGECTHLQKELDNTNRPSEGDCGYLYEACEEEYKLLYERCGASYKTVCVENCDEVVKKTPPKQEVQATPSNVNQGGVHVQ
jgi:hypothetical protein